MNIKVHTDEGIKEKEVPQIDSEENSKLNGFIYVDMNVYDEEEEEDGEEEEEENLDRIEIKEEISYEENKMEYTENLPLHSIKNLVNQCQNENHVSKNKKSVDFDSEVNIYQKENFSDVSKNVQSTEQTRYKLRTRLRKDTYRLESGKKHSKSKCNENFLDQTEEVNFQCLFCKKCFCSYELLSSHSKKCEQNCLESNKKCKSCGECFFSLSQLGHNCNSQENNLKCQKTVVSNSKQQECGSSDVYKCDICKEGFRYLNTLKKHIKAHMKNPFQCQSCLGMFQTQEMLGNHLCNPKSMEICNTCHVCDKKFSLASRLKVHILKHEGVSCKCFKCTLDNHSQDVECLLNIKNCSKCGKKYEDVPNNKKKLVYNKDSLLKCNDCKKVFLEVEKYTEHTKEKICQKVPNKKKFKYECDACGNTFMKLVKLKLHILNDHQGINYQCEKCGMKFTCEEDRDAHVAKQDCKPEDPCTCEICNKVFAKKDYLKKHQYMHTNVLLKCKYCYCAFMKEKSYQKHIAKMNCSKSARKIRMAEFNYKKCRLCEVEFESENALIEHFVASHPGQQPHQCFCCDSCLPTFQDLQNHIHHHNTQKYTCHLCGKPYTSQEGFRKHRLKHKGAEFKCRFCDSEFLNESRFKFHEKTCKKNPESGYEPTQEKPKKKSDKPKQSRQLHWESRIIMKRLRGDPNSTHNQENQNENNPSSTFFDEPETEPNVRGWFDDYYKTEEDDIAFGLKKEDDGTPKNNSDLDFLSESKVKKSCASLTLDEPTQTEDSGNGVDSCSENSSEKSVTDSSEEEEDIEDVDLPIDYNPKKCRLCVVAFNHEYELLHHFIKSHPGEHAHKCPHCDVCSPLFAQLKEHMKTHGIGMGVYNCDNCSKKFRSEKKMKSHNYRCKGMNVEVGVSRKGSQAAIEMCKKCGKKFHTKFGYKRHKPMCKGGKAKSKVPEKVIDAPLIEDVAERIDTDEEEELPSDGKNEIVFPDENVKNEEKEQTLEDKPTEPKKEDSKDVYIGEPPKDSFPCRLCDKKFQYERGIVMHFKSTHPGHKPLICHVCNMHLADKLKEHLKTHGIGEEFICELCGKRFNQKFLSKIHEMWHQGIEYKCKNCKQKFLNKEKMDKHIGENRCVNRQSLMRLPCDICGKSYRSKFGLSKHYITHTPKELRPVKNKMNCEYCGKWFENNNGLQRHRRIHTGERPFCCRFCPKAFAQEGNCKAHERIHTGESKPRKKKPPSSVPMSSPVVLPAPSLPLPSTAVVVDSMPYPSSINLFTYHTIDPNGTVH